ncbi:MAG TPA: GNAT family N-acetyltransferase [Kofleriaceae bacterium]|nr:GNAT family N-acetyltransferase [Kofleriaceae bacterium]
MVREATNRAPEFTVRLASAADGPTIVAAVRELLPGVDVAQRHMWLYRENPHGEALTWIATEEATGAVAGVTSFFPRRIVANGREVLAALGGDGYVRPAFRRRGLASAMHGMSRRDMQRFGIEVMFGTPMPANATPLARHGTQNVVEVVRYSRWLGGWLAPIGAFVRRALRAHVRLDEFSERDWRVDELWERTRPELGIATIRDAQFYDWRFRRSPSQRQQPFVVLDRGRPIAACALERVGRRLRVIDLLAPRDAWPRALSAIVASARDCDVVDIKLARTDANTRRLWQAGFLARDAPKPLNIMIPEGSRSADLYFDGAKWFFTLAESDQDTA